MRIIVNALIESMSALANLAAGVLVVWLIFCIFGVSLLAGKMYTCSNSSISTEAECLYYGFDWVNAPYHFDNVFAAWMVVFDMTSQENWPDVMYNGIDGVEIGFSRARDYNPGIGLFFVVIEFISNMFFLPLVLGVMFDKFEKAKRGNTSISQLILKNDQLRWVEMMKFIIRTKRVQEKPEVQSTVRLIILKFINHWGFNAFVMSCIVANMVVLGMDYEEASVGYKAVLDNLNMTFTGVFVMEAALKLFGLSPLNYFKDRWNCFDFFVVVSSLLDIILGLTVFSSGSNKMLTVGPQLARALRILRVTRLLRLVKKLRMIDDLVGMMSLSLPAIGNVLALLVLLFMIYGVLGVYLFHGAGPGVILDDYNKFTNFGWAVLVLIRSSTGEDWNYTRNDCAAYANPWATAIFFVTFECMTTFVMYNMFVMVMLQEYENYHNNPESSFKLYKKHLAMFNAAWNKILTGENKARMDTDTLINFAYEMGSEIGLSPVASRYEVKKHLGHFGIIPDEQGYVYYHDVLFRYMRRLYGSQKRTNKVHRKLLEKEEMIHIKKIRKISKVEKMTAVAKIMQTNNSQKGEMQFFDLIFLKSVFRSWKGYSRNRKETSDISDTPPMSLNYPGPNSPGSFSVVDEGEEEAKPETVEINTLQPVNTAGEVNQSREVKVSRMSTNFSRNRHDTQE